MASASQCNFCNMSFPVTVNFIFVAFFCTYTSQHLVVWFKIVLNFAFHIPFGTFEERGWPFATFMFRNEVVTLPFLSF